MTNKDDLAYDGSNLRAFPYSIKVSKLQARVFTDALLSENRSDGLAFSSFAVTVNTLYDGNTVDLQLSLISYNYLINEFNLKIDLSK